MKIQYDTLINTRIDPVDQTYDARDALIYALGVGCGMDPCDPAHLRYATRGDDFPVLPAFATVLAAPRVHSMNLGITMPKVLHGKQSLELHTPLPSRGHVWSASRVLSARNRGDGRGSIIDLERVLNDADSGTRYATMVTTLVCRGDQITGAPAGQRGKDNETDWPTRAADIVCDSRTSQQAALIYRLTGDENPIHSDPAAAASAGFARPILHGMATYGLCAFAAEVALCTGGDKRLRHIEGRFSAPVTPGETIRVELWRDEHGALLRASVPERDTVVFSQGRVTIDQEGG